MSNNDRKSVWENLLNQKTREEQQGIVLKDFFILEPDRLSRLTKEIKGLYFDASKTAVSTAMLNGLFDLARACGLENLRNQMFKGKVINTTENRAVLHTALRLPETETSDEPGLSKIYKDIQDTKSKMRSFAQSIRGGSIKSVSGKAFTDIVNIGIGGSDLGPHMVYEALKGQYDRPKVHFLSNIDAHQWTAISEQLNPETTLFLVASKTFTTIETLTNAKTAKDWLIQKLGDREDMVAKHFVALSTNFEAAKEFGIAQEHIFPFGDYVGGRFSLWSSIGLSLWIGLGEKAMDDLFAGAYAMDQHFLNNALEDNIPVLMALTGLWHASGLKMPALACLPYDQRLELLPAWLQQLDMESNGKSVDKQGQPVSCPTGPIVFGMPGTNGQHAFYQHLHQSQQVTPAEFIGVKTSDHAYKNDHHKVLLANMIAQAQALFEGSDNESQPHRHFTGNRPSTTLLLDRLDAYHLGLLLALYEHKTFVQGAIWGINSFDQWGVELGKSLAKSLLDQNSGNPDPSTQTLCALLKIS